MIEQYIYSRSERAFTNALHQTIPVGFGFMALSPGMDRTLKQDVAIHCEDCPRLPQTDSQGVPLPLFRKARLPRGQVLLQRSTWIERGSRDFHVAHGYVLDEAARAAGPAGWLSAQFQLRDPNAAPGGLSPLESLPELPGEKPLEPCRFKDAALGLDAGRYCQLILACFDALASRRQVLLAWDFEQPGERELRRSVLYWLYTCLPYDLWSGLGFDSVYTNKSSPGVTHLAFVDRTSIQNSGKMPSIQMGNQLLTLGGNFLVWDGEIIHNDGKYKTEWYGQGGGYGSWLKQLVKIVWDSPGERREAVVRTLEDIRQSLQSQMDSVPEKKRLNPEVYQKACERDGQLQKLREAVAQTKPEIPEVRPEVPKAKLEIPESKPEISEVPEVKPKNPETNRAVPRLFLDVLAHYTTPANPKDIQLLASIRDERLKEATGFLGALMAWDADTDNLSVCFVLDHYKQYVPPDVYNRLLFILFWNKMTQEERKGWEMCYKKNSAEAAKQRRDKWYREIAAEYNPVSDAASYERLSVFPSVGVRERAAIDAMKKELAKTIAGLL